MLSRPARSKNQRISLNTPPDIRLLASGAIKVKPMITHRIGLSQWREGFDAMVDKTAIKVIMTYDFDE